MANEYKRVATTGFEIAEAQTKLNERFNTGAKFTGEIASQYAGIQKATNLSDQAMGFLVKKQIKGEKTIENSLKDLLGIVTF